MLLLKDIENQDGFLFNFQETGHPITFALTPNAGKIVSSGDVKEICRLLQLLLVCAVNSPRAGDFVANIQNLRQDQQVFFIKW